MAAEFNILAGEPCLDFVNTLDNRPVPEKQQELLPDYQSLVEWGERAGIISHRQELRLSAASREDPPQAEMVLRRAVGLRECLYRVFDPILRVRRPELSDLDLLAIFVAVSYRHVRFSSIDRRFELCWNKDGSELHCLLWPIARSAANLLTSSDLSLVRECAVEHCRWLFVDRSRNHSRRWCDMKICGNRTKARKFYARGKKSANAGVRALNKRYRETAAKRSECKSD